jgi:hypothetical protein
MRRREPLTPTTYGGRPSHTVASGPGAQDAQRPSTGSRAAAPSLTESTRYHGSVVWGRGSEVNQRRAALLAALAAALPVLAGQVHGWLLTILAFAIGAVAALSLPTKAVKKIR